VGKEGRGKRGIAGVGRKRAGRGVVGEKGGIWGGKRAAGARDICGGIHPSLFPYYYRG